jgi:predicted nucleotidyltransferase
MITVTKVVKKYGNSGGVYVPSSWIGGRVRVNLIDEPVNPVKDVLEKISMEHVISVILYGSYARNEVENGSDVDMLLVTDENKRLSIPTGIKNKYDIQVKTPHALRNAMAHDPVFYKSVMDDAVAIINHKFLEDIRKETSPSKIRIEERLKLIESSLAITKKIVEMDYTQAKELIYPVFMRLKEIIILEYIIDNRKYSTHAFRQEILKNISSKEFLMVIDTYRSVRNGRKIPKSEISIETIMKLISFLEEKVHYVRKRARKKRDSIYRETDKAS